MREDECGALEFAQKVWDELLCFMQVRAESDVLAEQLVQDVLVRAARRIEPLTDPLRFRIWLYHIATGVIAERLRFADKRDGYEPLVVDGFTAEIRGCVRRLAGFDERQDFSEVLDMVAQLDIESKSVQSAAIGQDGKPRGMRQRIGANSGVRSARFSLLAGLVKACRVRMKSGSTSPPPW
jgi:DNA-directed RNA polymerase specialized sigma24 family protein